MAFQPGAKIRATELNRLGQVVGRNLRTTNISTPGSGAITRALSVRAPVKAGRSYRVQVQTEIDSSVAGDTSVNELRHTTNNTEPLVTSAILDRMLITHSAGGAIPTSHCLTGTFHASSDGWLRVVFCISRAIGSGIIRLSADSTFPTTITVEDIGDTIPTDGTVY